MSTLSINGSPYEGALYQAVRADHCVMVILVFLQRVHAKDEFCKGLRGWSFAANARKCVEGRAVSVAGCGGALCA